ncbi:ComGF family competence protein [Xylocopilactobacillus apis]|uniref:Competence protein ComGF n=1 Tax=Xylocopilactobacillus apis TaxID=2932183 RepID=A0AAU9D257_9LACO|nr:ComGF family competence protein [Xylocopilactobacillus apis]BDR56375.1 hypothetical protein KIMC2_09370 [Xylocopilactobacillus apis]
MKNKYPAFLLIEAIISLFITCLSLVVITMIVNCVKSVNQNITNNSVNDYHLAVIQRDIYLGDNFELMEFSQDKLKISNITNSGTIFLEKYKNMIRVRGIMGGHMPLLTDIDNLIYERSNNETVKETIYSNGKKFEGYLFFSPTQK